LTDIQKVSRQNRRR